MRVAACLSAFGVPAGLVNLLVSREVRDYADPLAVVVLDVVLMAVAVAVWRAPWGRWPDRAQLSLLAWSPLVTVATDRVYGYSATGAPIDGTVLYVVSVSLWLGFTQRRYAALLLAPLVSVPVIAHDAMRNGAGNVVPAIGMLLMSVVAAECIALSRDRERALVRQLRKVVSLSQHFEVTVPRDQLLEHLGDVVEKGLAASGVTVHRYDDEASVVPAGRRRIAVTVLPTVGPELRVGATLAEAIPSSARRSFELLLGEILGRFLEQHHGVTERLRTDPLTGLGNRVAADEALARLRPGDAVVLIDVDHFKSINDTFGHASGDAILQQVASFLRAQLRLADGLCRFGGDELLIVLRSSPDAEIAARAILERWSAQQPPVSLSAGLAVCGPTESGTHTLRRADDALYEAKNSGRGRLCTAGTVDR